MSTGELVRRSDGAAFGAWLFKCNPNRRDFTQFLREVAGVTAWCVAPTYRRELIGPDQPALLWVSGPGRTGPTPGLWAAGRTVGPVEEAQSENGQACANLRLQLLDDPVPRGIVAQVAELAALEVLRIPAGSNPSWVTDSEWVALAALLG